MFINTHTGLCRKSSSSKHVDYFSLFKRSHSHKMRLCTLPRPRWLPSLLNSCSAVCLQALRSPEPATFLWCCRGGRLRRPTFIILCHIRGWQQRVISLSFVSLPFQIPAQHMCVQSAGHCASRHTLFSPALPRDKKQCQK